MQGDSGPREGLTRVGLVAQNKEGDSVSRTEAKAGNEVGALYKSPRGQGLEGKALTREPECPPSPPFLGLPSCRERTAGGPRLQVDFCSGRSCRERKARGREAGRPAQAPAEAAGALC